MRTLFGGEFVADDIFAPADTTEFTPYMEQVLDAGADAFLVTGRRWLCTNAPGRNRSGRVDETTLAA